MPVSETTLGLMEVCQVLVIGEQGDRVSSPLEIMSPMIKGMYDSKQFTIIDIIILFCTGESLGKVCTRMEVTISISLHEDSPASEERCVGHYDKGVVNVREVVLHTLCPPWYSFSFLSFCSYSFPWPSWPLSLCASQAVL